MFVMYIERSNIKVMLTKSVIIQGLQPLEKKRKSSTSEMNNFRVNFDALIKLIENFYITVKFVYTIYYKVTYNYIFI